jgi:hypothetical protein
LRCKSWRRFRKKVTIDEAIKTIDNVYKALLKNGWTLKDIDEMDIHYFFKLHEEKEEIITYADQVPWL